MTGDDIKLARERTGMSQEAFARALGVGRSTVINWERGRFKPPANIFERVSAISPDIIANGAAIKANAKLANEVFEYYCRWRRQGNSHESLMYAIKDPARTALMTDRALQQRIAAIYPDILGGGNGK